MHAFFENIQTHFGILVIAGLFFLGGYFSGSLVTENQLAKSADSALGSTNDRALLPEAESFGQPQPGELAAVTADDWQKGASDPVVTLVKYSDFDCPFCQRFHDTLNQVISEYPDQVQVVMRHYPLPSHPNAQKLAEASECIGELGGDAAFWQFADIYFGRSAQGVRTAMSEISQLATEAGVSGDQVSECIESGRMAQKVQDQMESGVQAGVSGTPGTLVVTSDGAQEMIPGALPIEQVRTIIGKYL
ncbi:MAG: DsbA family protein [Patescibacteria group bacterium]